MDEKLEEFRSEYLKNNPLKKPNFFRMCFYSFFIISLPYLLFKDIKLNEDSKRTEFLQKRNLILKDEGVMTILSINKYDKKPKRKRRIEVFIFLIFID
jgi:hypothetical protein